LTAFVRNFDGKTREDLVCGAGTTARESAGLISSAP
jgi:hypothetical protein